LAKQTLNGFAFENLEGWIERLESTCEGEQTVFQVGDTVVHPGYGAGKVVDIEKLSCLGSDKSYYSIKLLDGSETQVWVPVQDAEKKGIRPPIASSQLSEVWRLLRAQPKTLPSDHQQRYGIVRQKLENGDVLQIAEALRDLSWKDYHVRSLTSEGKRLYDKAMKLLATEVALVRGSDPDRVESQISRVLDENIAHRAASSSQQ
jgi:CarD family transcriptional regulator